MKKIVVEKLPDRGIEIRAVRSAGNISDAFNILKRPAAPVLSLEEINKLAAQGWARKR